MSLKYCSGAKFPFQGKKNGIWPVLCVNPRTSSRTMWMQIQELCHYLCTPWLPQLECTRKRGPDFTIYNFQFMQQQQYSAIASSFMWRRKIYCVTAMSEMHWFWHLNLKFSVKASACCRTKFCQVNFGMTFNFKRSYIVPLRI